MKLNSYKKKTLLNLKQSIYNRLKLMLKKFNTNNNFVLY